MSESSFLRALNLFVQNSVNEKNRSTNYKSLMQDLCLVIYLSPPPMALHRCHSLFF